LSVSYFVMPPVHCDRERKRPRLLWLSSRLDLQLHAPQPAYGCSSGPTAGQQVHAGHTYTSRALWCGRYEARLRDKKLAMLDVAGAFPPPRRHPHAPMPTRLRVRGA